MANPWECPKCGNNQYSTSELRATGGFLSKLFDVQTEKFKTVSCDQCGFTEMYKRTTGTLSNVVDFFAGG